MKILAIISILGVLGACASTGSVSNKEPLCHKIEARHLPQCGGGDSVR